MFPNKPHITTYNLLTGLSDHILSGSPPRNTCKIFYPLQPDQQYKQKGIRKNETPQFDNRVQKIN